jgi:hypothetical protein
MTRKDSEKDAERPHYYSQFWLDVAAGRRVIGAPKSDEGTEVAEPETPEPIILRKPARNNISDGYADTYSRTAVEPPLEEVIEPELETEPELEPDEFELADEVNEVDDLDLPNILVDDTLEEATEDTELAEMDADLMPVEEEEEDFFDEEEEDEEENEDWPIGRGRKKPKPGRQVKPPKPLQKKPRRDSRRGGY